MTLSRGRPRWRRRILAIVIVPLAVLLCMLIATFVLDSTCYSGLSQRLPVYPGATITFERHSGPRAFGMGETLMIIETDDPEQTVRDWYGRNSGGAVRRMQQTGQYVLLNLTDASYSVTKRADGTGTQVTLSGVCGGY